MTAIAVTIALMVITLWKQDHPGLFLGQLSGSAVLWIEISLMVLFVIFSAFNWQCPSCNSYLGHSINRSGCRKCGSRFC